MAQLLFAVMSIFGFLLLSEREVIALSGFMLSARLKIFLHAFHLCEHCLWLRSTTGWAHSLYRFTFLPYEIRGPALLDPRWLYGSVSLACEASYAPLPSAPPTGGDLAQWPPRHSCSRRIYDSDSVHGGPLDKLIWEDAERGTVVAPWSCTASAHLCQSRQAKCLGLHVFLNVVVLNSFSHVFESDAVVKPLCPLANLFGGCFCLGSGPFCVSGLLFLLTKRKSGWGICGSSGWSLCCLVCCDLPAFPDPFGPCTNWRFTAYAHVRTEPQCDIGHTRGKKKHVLLCYVTLYAHKKKTSRWLRGLVRSSPNKQTNSEVFLSTKNPNSENQKSQDMFSHVVLQLSLLVVCDFLFPRPQEVVGGWVQSFSELAKLEVDAMV